MCVPSNDILVYLFPVVQKKKITIKASRYECTSLVHNNHHVSSRVAFYNVVVEYPFVCDTFTIYY